MQRPTSTSTARSSLQPLTPTVNSALPSVRDPAARLGGWDTWLGTELHDRLLLSTATLCYGLHNEWDAGADR